MRVRAVVAVLAAACCVWTAQASVVYHNDFSDPTGMWGGGWNNSLVCPAYEDPNYDPVTAVSIYVPAGLPAGGGYNYFWMTPPNPSTTPNAANTLPGAPYNFTGCTGTCTARTDCYSTEALGTGHALWWRVYSGVQDPNGSWTLQARAAFDFSYQTNMGWNTSTHACSSGADANGGVSLYNGATAWDPTKVINMRFDDPSWDSVVDYPLQITIDDLSVATTPPPGLCGDANCDGLVNNGDIDAFIEAITNSTQYAIDHPGCPLTNSDANQDTLVNNGDIDAFISVITGGPGCGH